MARFTPFAPHDAAWHAGSVPKQNQGMLIGEVPWLGKVWQTGRRAGSVRKIEREAGAEGDSVCK